MHDRNKCWGLPNSGIYASEDHVRNTLNAGFSCFHRWWKDNHHVFSFYTKLDFICTSIGVLIGLALRRRVLEKAVANFKVALLLCNVVLQRDLTVKGFCNNVCLTGYWAWLWPAARGGRGHQYPEAGAYTVTYMDRLGGELQEEPVFLKNLAR